VELAQISPGKEVGTTGITVSAAQAILTSAGLLTKILDASNGQCCPTQADKVMVLLASMFPFGSRIHPLAFLAAPQVHLGQTWAPWL